MPSPIVSPPSVRDAAPASRGLAWRWLGLAGLILAAVFGLSWVGGSKADSRAGDDGHVAAPKTAMPVGSASDSDDDDHPLPEPTVLVGRVRGAAASGGGAVGPVAGASVCVWTDADRLQGRLRSHCARTDRDGHYEIVGAPAARVRVTATAAGFVPGPRPGDETGDVRLRAGETVRLADIVLAPGGRPAKGRVVDALGGPIEGAEIVALEPYPIPTPLATGRSDGEGRFELWVGAGRHHLRAEADGYAAAMVEREVPGPTIELVLAPESSISGVVVDARGTAVAGARVQVDDPSDARPGAIEARADDAGRFRIGGLAPGRYHPKASAAAAFGETDGSLAVGLAEHVENVRIVVADAASLTVTVVRDDETPCERGLVAVYAKGPAQFAPADLDHEGVARFDSLLPDTYDVLARCDGIGQTRLDTPVTIDAGPHTLSLTVATGRRLHGKVLDGAGTPLPAAEVMAYGVETGAATIPIQANCDDEGAFELAGLSPGRYELRASSPDHAWPESLAFAVADADPADVEIRFPDVGAVEGYVRGDGGAPVSGAQVGVRRINAFSHEITDTDDDGHFVLDGLTAGDYLLVAELVGGPQTEEIEVRVGPSATLRRDLSLATGAAAIDGTVLGPDGDPVADAWVYATRQDDGASADFIRNVTRLTIRLGLLDAVLTDEDGHFRFEGLSEGKYTVHARRPGGGEAWKTDVPAGTSTRLSLPELVTLRGTVTTSAGGAATALAVSILEQDSGLQRTETFLQPRRDFAFDALVPGRYVVTARALEGNGKVTVSASTGTARADVTLQAKVPIRGRLVDLDTGEPQPGVAVVAGTQDTSLADLAGDFERLTTAGDSTQISDAQGRFTLELTPGPSRLLALSRDMTTGKYEPHLIAFDVSAHAPVGPTFELVQRRVTDRANVGNIGIDQGFSQWCDGIELGKVAPGSAAEAGGLVEGMPIASVDGHSVQGQDCYRYIWLTHVPPGRTITITPVGGAPVEITAK